MRTLEIAEMFKVGGGLQANGGGMHTDVIKLPPGSGDGPPPPDTPQPGSFVEAPLDQISNDGLTPQEAAVYGAFVEDVNIAFEAADGDYAAAVSAAWDEAVGDSFIDHAIAVTYANNMKPAVEIWCADHGYDYKSVQGTPGICQVPED